MKEKGFEKFKKSGKIEDYLNYIDEKKKEVEFAQEYEKSGIKRRNNCKNN